MGVIRLHWQQIHHIHTPSLQALLARYPTVFKEDLGTLRGYQAKIYVDPDAVPRFNRARSVPYAFKDKVDKELQRLRDEGTLEPVEIVDWAAPIVVVLKKDKSVRICGDFSVTVNPVSKLDRYPIPKVSDLFAQLGKGKFFSKQRLSASTPGGRVQEVRRHKHSQGTLRVYSSSVRDCIGSRDLPAGDREFAAGH